MTENEAKLFNNLMEHNSAYYGYELSKGEIKTVLQAFEQLKQYRVIGTVEKCRVAVERMKAKKVKDMVCDYGDYFGRCPICDRGVANQFGTPYKYCPFCGIKLDWSE